MEKYDGEKSIGEIIFHAMLYSSLLFLSITTLFGVVYLFRHYLIYRVLFVVFFVTVVIPMIYMESQAGKE